MQLSILLKKDITSLFKQKAIIFTLLLPMLLIVGIGILPTLIGINQPFEVGYLNNDQSYNSTNIGNVVINELTEKYEDQDNINLVKLDNFNEFLESENAFWLPSNFSQIAFQTGNAKYFMKISESDLRANTIMESTIGSEIKNIVTEQILSVSLPQVEHVRIYADGDSATTSERQNRAEIAFPLAYMSFLILILSTSSMRVTGFSAEKESGMMELLLSSVINRKELVMSKLITGVLYGLGTVLSYIIGILLVYLFQGGTNPGESVAILILPAELLTPLNMLVIFFLFADLAFMAIQILLGAQLLLGREAGDRLGSMILMILSFVFYFGSIGNPLAESGLQVVNPFFWPFRIALNIIFEVKFIKTVTYIGLNLGFSWYLLLLKTRAIEKENMLFE